MVVWIDILHTYEGKVKQRCIYNSSTSSSFQPYLFLLLPYRNMRNYHKKIIDTLLLLGK